MLFLWSTAGDSNEQRKTNDPNPYWSLHSAPCSPMTLAVCIGAFNQVLIQNEFKKAISFETLGLKQTKEELWPV